MAKPCFTLASLLLSEVYYCVGRCIITEDSASASVMLQLRTTTNEAEGQLNASRIEHSALWKVAQDIAKPSAPNYTGVGATKLPRKLWQFWEQGHIYTTAPPRIQECFYAWPALNAPHWQRQILNESDVYRMFPNLLDILTAEPKTVEARSDLLRLHVLAEFGGVWADASVLPVVPLDAYIDELVSPAGFFAFQFHHFKSWEDDDTVPSLKDPELNRYGHIASWFLASEPGNQLVVKWRDAFTNRWTSGKLFKYYEVHQTMVDLVQEDPHARTIFDQMPVLTEELPHSCQQDCTDYWEATKPAEYAHMFKYPTSDAHFMQEYWSAVGVREPTVTDLFVLK